MSEGENNSVIKWVADMRVGVKKALPLCLVRFATAELTAEQDQYLAAQREGRRVMAPCVFCKPSFDKSEEGDETIKVKLKIPDAYSGGAGLSGMTARELLGKTRVRIDFSRRAVGEWGQGEIIADGPNRIVSCETEVASFSWSDSNWQFSFLISADRFSLDDAIEIWKKQGSVRLELLGQAIEGDSDSDAEESEAEPVEPKKGRKKKTEAAATPTKSLPGVGPDDLIDRHNVALTTKFKIDIAIRSLPDGRFSCEWTGDGPVGACEQNEPSIRAAAKEAVSSSLGNAVDFWDNYDGDEETEVVKRLRFWIRELEAGKTPAMIESEGAL